MKLRIICTESDFGTAAHTGGPVKVIKRTFDVEATPELADWLNNKRGTLIERWIDDVEVIRERD